MKTRNTFITSLLISASISMSAMANDETPSIKSPLVNQISESQNLKTENLKNELKFLVFDSRKSIENFKEFPNLGLMMDTAKKVFFEKMKDGYVIIRQSAVVAAPKDKYIEITINDAKKYFPKITSAHLKIIQSKKDEAEAKKILLESEDLDKGRKLANEIFGKNGIKK